MAFPSYPVRLLLRAHHFDKVEPIGPNRKGAQVTVSYQRVLGTGNKSITPVRLSPPLLVPVPCELIAASIGDHHHQQQQPPHRQSSIATLILTTKAFQALEAVKSVQHRLSSETRIVLLLNGAMAVREELQRHFEARQLFSPRYCCAWTTHGAYQPPKHSSRESASETGSAATAMFGVVHAGASGQTRVEDWPELAVLWDRASLNCESVSSPMEMQHQLWLKLAANCVINPLTSRYQCTNGELLDRLRKDPESGEDLVRGLVDELVRVARRQGQSALTVEDALRFVHQVLLDTVDNYSSMVQDLRARRRTEVDYLNGYVVRRGRELGLDCPLNQQMWDEVRSMTDPAQWVGDS